MRFWGGKNVHPHFQQQQKTVIHLLLNQKIVKQIFFFFILLIFQSPQNHCSLMCRRKALTVEATTATTVLFFNCFLQSLPVTQCVGGGGGGWWWWCWVMVERGAWISSRDSQMTICLCFTNFHRHQPGCYVIQMIQSKRRRRRRRREPRDISTPLQNWATDTEKNTCVQLLYRLKWKSKEIIWHHWNWNIWKVPTFYFIIFHRLQSVRGSMQDFWCVSHSYSSSCKTRYLSLPIVSPICYLGVVIRRSGGV